MGNVLVVDDQQEMCTSVGRALSAAGHRPLLVPDGRAAMRALKEQLFDVAVVDYWMSPCNGLEVLQEIRTQQPSCARVLMSGSLQVPVLADAVNRGEVTRVLQKPFDTAELLALVDDALAAHEHMKALMQVRGRQADGSLDAALTECLAGGFVKLALQPIKHADGEGLFAYELLMRSTHPLLSNPAAVLDAAERCRRVVDVADVVASLTADWLGRVARPVKLFVNLHPRELENTEALRARLNRWSGAEDRVVIEITERSAVMDMEGWEASVRLLTERGFAIAIDDVGSGYNSLSVLAELSPRFLKVDMSIVRNIHLSQRKKRLVELLCRFGEACETMAIAEGIECTEEAATVRQAGAQLLQGYFLGRPSLELPAA